MRGFTKIFKFIELTRSVPQVGYALSGIQKDELSNLAEHHYLVTVYAWVLARYLKAKKAKINIERVLEFALVHDIGEVLGGDIHMPYARANPHARSLAKAFEQENFRFIAKLFGHDEKHIAVLGKEIFDARSTEAVIAKIADFLEVTHYKLYVRRLTLGDIAMAAKAIEKKLKNTKDRVVKKEMTTFMRLWTREMRSGRHEDFFEQSKLRSR